MTNFREENERKESNKEKKDKEEGAANNAATKKSKKSELFFIVFPSLDEVRAYYRTRSIVGFTAEEFYDYYTSFGWCTKGGQRIRDWQALMRVWERNNNRLTGNNLTYNENLRKEERGAAHRAPHRSGLAGRRAAQAEDARQSAHHNARPYDLTSLEVLDYWLQEHYALPRVGYCGYTADEVALVEAFMQKYSLECQTEYIGREALERVRNWPVLEVVERRVGRCALMHVLMRHLHELARDLDVPKRNYSPYMLERTALLIKERYACLTVPEFILAFNLCRRGTINVLQARLTPATMMQAMDRFMEWRAKQRRSSVCYL